MNYWLGEGLGAGRNRIRSWIAGFGDRLAAIDIDGERAYVLRADLEELAATPPTAALRLLPGDDQWVLGPSTADAHIVPPARRRLVSRQANIVIVGGVVSGPGRRPTTSSSLPGSSKPAHPARTRWQKR